MAGQSAQSAATPVQPKSQLGRDRGDRNCSNAFDVNTRVARGTADMIVYPSPAIATASNHVAPGRGLTVRVEFGLPHSPVDVRYCPTLPPFFDTTESNEGDALQVFKFLSPDQTSTTQRSTDLGDDLNSIIAFSNRS